MKRISWLCCAFLKENLLAPLKKLAMIPPAVKAVPSVPQLAVLRMSLALPEWQGRRPPDTVGPSGECQSCKSVVNVNRWLVDEFATAGELVLGIDSQTIIKSTRSSEQQHLFSVDRCSRVYQLLPPGPLVTLKNGFVLSGFGRLRSLDRSSTQKEESLRA
jgi:hypothetical protein